MFRTIQFCLLLSMLACVSAVSAQNQPKYGHMNLGNLLEKLPETKAATASLKEFTEKMAAKDDSIQKAFQAEVKQYQTDYQSGTLPPVQAQQKEAELQKKQQAIQAFEQDAQQQVAAERERLLKPILDKINETVKTVSTENGFMMVFDTSTGVTLFADTSIDITALVKKKLGIE
jgi:outer membrane protein